MTASWDVSADLVVVGSGVAGLTAASEAASLGLRVLVVTKGSVSDTNTRWAQGGIAVVLPGEHDPDDSVRKHISDTLTAGVGLCDEQAVTTILANGPGAVAALRRAGATFDPGVQGRLARTREGGHSASRVIHAGGDATGAEVERALIFAVRENKLSVLSHHTAISVLRSPQGVCGLSVLSEDGSLGVIHAPAVLLATGGLGQLYRATSNPSVATGDGIALALRAGAAVADMEFVQFHPTVLYTGSSEAGRRPLVTEAVRGEGALLIDGAGARVMAGVHPLEDLAPRDVVSAAIARRMAESPGGIDDHVFLDATHLSAEKFQVRFPTVFAACLAVGLDPSITPIPVAPAAHFGCGGVVTSVDGRTAIPGLYAAGEVARTGLHGANRLASNSLLEGLVVGSRVARAVAADVARRQVDPSDGERGGLESTSDADGSLPELRMADRPSLQAFMSRSGAIGRTSSELSNPAWDSSIRTVGTRADVEDAALDLTARALMIAAHERSESRGCHVRTDFPERSENHWRHSLVVRLDPSGNPVLAGTLALGGVA